MFHWLFFTTAYSNYAVESCEFAAVDYLLKPIEFDRFLKAANKAHGKLSTDQRVSTISSELQILSTVLINSGTSFVKIKLNEILYIEGTGNYLTFVLPKEKIMSLLTMGEILELLPSTMFSRIHKSFIVSHDKVRSIDRNSVRIAEHEIPLSATFRDDFLRKIKSL